MSTISRVLLTVLSLLPIAAVTARAQTSPSSVEPGPVGPPLATAQTLSGAIAVDGRLDESAWATATPISEFRQYEPSEGAPASLPTEVRVLYDDQAIYIGARMTQPADIVAPLARRDQLLDGNGNNGAFNSLTTDKLVVSLDPYHNHLDNVLFEINPAGVRGDQLNGDSSWDPIWQASASTDSDGWTAEMRIPLSQLRFSPDATQSWGMQVWRYIDSRNERDMWSFWEQTQQGGPAFFGDLEGLSLARQPRQLEIMPYLVTGSTFQNLDPADPYQDSPDLRLGVGGDLKYLLTSSLTLDATFNPDFGQVEVDPATLNLSAFETFYEEQRPFFVAGSSAFQFGRNRCMFCTAGGGIGAFYSRRIGRSPQLAGTLDDVSSFADTPDNTSILAAAKVTGRTQGGYTIGVLNAVTGEETARYLADGTGIEEQQTVEPMSNYFVARVNKEFDGGTSTFGGIFTSTLRQNGDALVEERLRSHAEAVGLDWYHSWSRRNYSWMGTTVFSNVAGSPDAIARTMRSSAHYYQRPDREVTGDGLFDTRYDTGATSMQGYGMYTRVGKDGGGVLRWELMTAARSPGLELNDLAFQNRGDWLYVNGNVGGNWTTPTPWYRSIFTSVGGSSQNNFDGDQIGATVQAFMGLEFLNYWNLRTFVIHRPDVLDDQLTRGGPVVGGAGSTFGSFGLSTDARSPIVLNFQVEGAVGTDDTRSLTLRPGMAIKPSPAVFIQLAPSLQFDEDAAQYIDRFEDPTATAFYGNRYLFGFIDKRTLSLETRINATFTPDITLQLFAQPFIATGEYSRFREFAAPRSLDKVTYGEDAGEIGYDSAADRYAVDPDGLGPARTFTFENPDFTQRSIRGTAVLRWEYRPGSTLFLVWTQQRSGEDPSGQFDFGNARRMILQDDAVNVFQVKATYWIG